MAKSVESRLTNFPLLLEEEGINPKYLSTLPSIVQVMPWFYLVPYQPIIKFSHPVPEMNSWLHHWVRRILMDFILSNSSKISVSFCWSVCHAPGSVNRKRKKCGAIPTCNQLGQGGIWTYVPFGSSSIECACCVLRCVFVENLNRRSITLYFLSFLSLMYCKALLYIWPHHY